MARNIAKVVHDLRPPMEMMDDIICILNKIISQDHSQKKIDQIIRSLKELTNLSHTMVQYLHELDMEAIQENIVK